MNTKKSKNISVVKRKPGRPKGSGIKSVGVKKPEREIKVSEKADNPVLELIRECKKYGVVKIETGELKIWFDHPIDREESGHLTEQKTCVDNKDNNKFPQPPTSLPETDESEFSHSLSVEDLELMAIEDPVGAEKLALELDNEEIRS